jgi:hypothetical protein
MHIFIDESGVFNPAPDPKASCLAALLIPSGNKARVFRDFGRLSASWPHEDGEIKGYLLGATHIVQLVELLHRNDALVEISAFDSALQTRDELEAVQKGVSTRIASAPGWTTAKLKPPRRIGAAYGNTSLQLFIQAFLMQSLIYETVQSSLSYYGRRSPKELKHYNWLVDQKDKKLHKFEKAWSEITFPSIATITRQRPFKLLAGGDYSYLKCEPSEQPDLLAATLGVTTSLEKGLKFGDSKESLGLQMADVIANAVATAFNEPNERGGWQSIGKLILERPLQAIPFVLLTDDKNRPRGPQKITHPFSPVMTQLSQNNRQIHLDADGEKWLAKQERRREKKS